MSKIKLQDIKKAVDYSKEVLPLIEPAIPLIKEYGPEVADKMVKKATEAGNAADAARKDVLARIQQRKDGKEAKKALEEAKRKIVQKSLPPIAADEFYKNFEENIVDPHNLTDGYMAICGCYAILTFKSAREKDLSKYQDVYIGASRSMGFGVYSQLQGFGNVDVYADYKFKAPMKVLLYPCDESELQGQYEELAESFQAFRSYNAWDIAGLSIDSK